MPGQAEALSILVVDDEEHVRRILARCLEAEGYVCSVAGSGHDALKLMEAQEFHLVLSDIMMPGMSGIELLEVIGALYPDTPVLMVTAVDDRATATQALELGAYGHLLKPFSMREVAINVANALERRRLTLLSHQYERELEAKVQERTREVTEKARQIREREQEIVFRLLSSMGYRDDETGAHAWRIGLYSAVLGRQLGWEQNMQETIKLAAPMHDLGKIGIRDGILRKPDKLTIEEFEAMKRHTVIGAKILGGSDITLLRLAAEIALSHHEKWDGSGYPQRSSGNDIPQSGRIVAVADVYDALVHERVYKPAFSEDTAVSIMKDGKDKHFDAMVLEAFLDTLGEMRRIREQVRENRDVPHCSGGSV
jgi:putative two-component system response regulator